MSRSRTRFRLVVALLGVGAPLVAACGVGIEDSPRVRDREEIPFGLAEPATTVPGTPALPVIGTTPLCFVDGELVVPRPGPGDDSLVDRLRRAPSAADERVGITNALPDPGLIGSATVSGGVAEVDLRSDFEQLSSAAQRLAVAQVVCTASYAPGIGQVRFTLDGVTLSVPQGDGSLSDAPVSMDDFEGLVAER